MLIFSQLFSSLGIGLLVGVLLGLSTSPVVGLVVGAITAMLASLIGLTPLQKDVEPEVLEQRLKLGGLRAGMFGLACVLGIGGGIYLRAHNVLSPASPSLMERKAELVQLGFSEEDARAILVREGVDAATAETQPSHRNTVLFSATVADCTRTYPDNFASFAALHEGYAAQKLEPFLAYANALSKRGS